MQSCRRCGKLFKSLRSLQRHELTNCMNGLPVSSKYSCEICQSKFISPAHLKRHLKSHAKLMEYSCTSCGQRFSQATHLKRHNLTRHGAPDSFKSHCCAKSNCNAKFLSAWELRRHLKKAHRPGKTKGIRANSSVSKNSFHCSVCPDAPEFSRAADLRSHLNCQHLRACRFQCRLCINQKFLQRVQFDRHWKKFHSTSTHSGSHQCQICWTQDAAGSDLYTVAELTQHYQNDHEISKLFLCPYCLVPFRLTVDRALHCKSTHFIQLDLAKNSEAWVNRDCHESLTSDSTAIEDQSKANSSESSFIVADNQSSSQNYEVKNGDNSISHVRLLINIVSIKYADRRTLNIGDAISPSLLTLLPSLSKLEINLLEPSQLGQIFCLDLLAKQTGNNIPPLTDLSGSPPSFTINL